MSNILILQDNSRQLQQDPPPGDLLPGTGSSCSRILRLDPEQQPGETAWKWTGMDRNGLQRLRRGTGKIFAGAEVHRPGKRPYRAAAGSSAW